MKFLKRFHLYEVVFIIAVLGMHLYAALSDPHNMPGAWFTRDDAYYYFKVAQNITEGHGSTFDGINLSNGYHPLWMLICIPVFFLARFDLILPLRILLMIMGALNAATAILIYRLVKANLSHAVAIMAGLFWSFNVYIHYTMYEFGLESPIALFSVALFIYKLSQFEKEWRNQTVTSSQLAQLGGIGVLVLFSRLDLIFLAVIGGIWVIFRDEAIRHFLPLDMVIVFASMSASIALRTGIDAYNTVYAASALEATILALLVKSLMLFFVGGYQHPRTKTVWKTIQQTILALGGSSILLAGLYTILVSLGIGKSFPRTAFFVDFGISTTLIVMLRLAAYWFGRETAPKTETPLQEFKSNWKNWLSEGLSYFGVLGGALVFYMALNKIMFGTSSPVSGQIKRWWGTLGRTSYDNPPFKWTEFFGISYRGAYDTWQPLSNFFHWITPTIRWAYPGADTLDERYYIAMAATIVIAVIILFLNACQVRNKITNMALIPLMAGCGIHILSYTATAYGGAKEWYWISQLVFLVLFESLLLDILLKPLQKFRTAQITLQFAALFIGIFLACRLGNYFIMVMPYNFYPQDKPYLDVIPFLEENTPPGAIIGMTGGGNVGYFIHDRTIVNMDGLINSYDYFKSIQDGTAPIYLREHGMQIVFANSGLLKTPPYYGQFDPYLRAYNIYGGKSLMHLLDEPKY
jgi:hypothetical protein